MVFSFFRTRIYILILRTVYFWCANYLCDVIWTLLSATRSPLKKQLNYHKNATFNYVLHSFAIIFTICNMDLLPIFLIRWMKRRPMWPTVFFSHSLECCLYFINIRIAHRYHSFCNVCGVFFSLLVCRKYKLNC